MTTAPLRVERAQILALRRRVGDLDDRLPPGADSLRTAAPAGLQDSMPRAGLLSIHTRVSGTTASVLYDPSLAQVWGPRYSVFVIPAEDRAPFNAALDPEVAEDAEAGGSSLEHLRDLADVLAKAEPSQLEPLLQALVARIEVESREAMQPTFRIPKDPGAVRIVSSSGGPLDPGKIGPFRRGR